MKYEQNQLNKIWKRSKNLVKKMNNYMEEDETGEVTQRLSHSFSTSRIHAKDDGSSDNQNVFSFFNIE